jgi:hypothetical protein
MRYISASLIGLGLLTLVTCSSKTAKAAPSDTQIRIIQEVYRSGANRPDALVVYDPVSQCRYLINPSGGIQLLGPVKM